MNAVFRAVLVFCFLSGFASADDTVTEFSFRTVEGKTIDYKAANKMLMVINIGAHW